MINDEILKEAEEKSQVRYISNLEKKFDSASDESCVWSMKVTKDGYESPYSLKPFPLWKLNQQYFRQTSSTTSQHGNISKEEGSPETSEAHKGWWWPETGNMWIDRKMLPFL